MVGCHVRLKLALVSGIEDPQGRLGKRICFALPVFHGADHRLRELVKILEWFAAAQVDAKAAWIQPGTGQSRLTGCLESRADHKGRLAMTVLPAARVFAGLAEVPIPYLGCYAHREMTGIENTDRGDS